MLNVWNVDEESIRCAVCNFDGTIHKCISYKIRLVMFKVSPTLVHCLLLWYMLYHAYNVLSLNCYKAKRLKCKLNWKTFTNYKYIVLHTIYCIHAKNIKIIAYKNQRVIIIFDIDYVDRLQTLKFYSFLPKHPINAVLRISFQKPFNKRGFVVT